MASHRYWRVSHLIPIDGGPSIELSELQLLDGGTRVDGLATLTSSRAPSSGALANLQDGSAAEVASFPRDGLHFDWDMGSAVEVNNFAMGAGAEFKFPVTLSLSWSDDGVSYKLLRSGDAYVYPGRGAMTRNLSNASPRVRSSGALWAVNTGPTSTALQWPPLVEIGDLLVASVVTATTSPTVPPAGEGWTRQAAAGVGGANVSYTEVWTKLVQTDADRVASAALWTSLTNAHVVALSAGLRAPFVDAIATKATGTLNDSVSAFPEAIATGDGRLAIMAAYWSLAFTGGSTATAPANVTPSTWVRLTDVPVLYLRLTVCALTGMTSGQATSGTATTQAAGSGGGWSMAAVVFGSPEQIETRGGYGTTRALPSPYRTLPLQPVPSQVDYAALRSLDRSRLRYDFVSPMRGAGIGRISGTTKDKASPNIPVSERVMLFRQSDCQPVRAGVSEPGTGAFSFDYIDETEKYFVVAFDHNLTFRAVIADNLTPDLVDGVLTAKPPVAVRSPGAVVGRGILSATLSLPVPPAAAVGDLLVAVVMRRTALTPPAGWSLLSSAGPATNNGTQYIQYSDVYGKVAEAGDLAAPAVFTQAEEEAFVGQMLALTSVSGAPLSQTQATRVVSAEVVQSVALPAVARYQQTGRLALAVASCIYASNGSTSIAMTGGGAWGQVSDANASANRLGVFTKGLSAGEVPSGTANFGGFTQTVPNGLTAHTLVFVAP